MTKEEFWEEFRPLAAGFSARQVARLLETSFSSTSRWVKGASAPTAIARPVIVAKLRAIVEQRAKDAEELRALGQEMQKLDDAGEVFYVETGEDMAVACRVKSDLARERCEHLKKSEP